MSELKIGDLIKQSRIDSGYITKKDLSEVSGVSPATLSRIENNTQVPSPETIAKISQYLVTVTYGDLMKAAGHLDGLIPEHSNAVIHIFNENAELDQKINTMFDKLAPFLSKDDSLYRRVIKLFDTDPTIINETLDLKQIKSLFKFNDFDIETKKNILEQLSYEFNQFSPKLVSYFEQIRNINPVPLVGTICAGNGIFPDEEIEQYINYPFLNKSQPDYALRVKGSSMINAGIEDGDIVFLRKATWAEYNGQIVAAIVNGADASLKRLKWSSDSAKFTLVPENDSYQSVEVMPNEVIICGVYAGHFKQEF